MFIITFSLCVDEEGAVKTVFALAGGSSTAAAGKEGSRESENPDMHEAVARKIKGVSLYPAGTIPQPCTVY